MASGPPSISVGGTEVPIFTLDDAAVWVTITPATLAGEVCAAVKEQYDIPDGEDYCYGLFDEDCGVLAEHDSSVPGLSVHAWGLRLMDDATPVSHVLRGWTDQPQAWGGRHRLVFKRWLYIPQSPSANHELDCDWAGPATGPVRLAYLDARFAFVHSLLRCDPAITVPQAAALLLQINRGPASDQPASQGSPLQIVTRHLADLVPYYSVAAGELPAAHPNHHGMRPAATALRAADMANRIVDVWRGLARMTVGGAQKAFVYLLRESCLPAGLYGALAFCGKRLPAVPADPYLSPTAPPDFDASAISGRLTGAGTHAGEDVQLFVGWGGLSISSCGADCLTIQTIDLIDVSKWTVSPDGKVFAFIAGADTPSPALTCVLTDAADAISAALDAIIKERLTAAAGSGPATGNAQRSRRGLLGKASTARPCATTRFSPPPDVPYALPTALLAADCRDAAAGTPWTGGTVVKARLPIAAAQPGMGRCPVRLGGGKAGGGADPNALPPGWVALKDADGDTYYYNEDTEETSWDRPVAKAAAAAPAPAPAAGATNGGLLPGWVALKDADGDTYYYNEDTEESSWDPPLAKTSAPAAGTGPSASSNSGNGGLPPGWVALKDADGDTYYYNEDTEETSWDRPTAPAAGGGAALPRGWVALKDADGDTYYYNEETEESSWDRPTA